MKIKRLNHVSRRDGKSTLEVSFREGACALIGTIETPELSWRDHYKDKLIPLMTAFCEFAN